MARASDRPEDACILSCGARTSAGLDVPSTAAAVRAGIAAFAEHPFMIDRFGKPMIVARDAELPEDLSGPERLVALLLPVLKEALSSQGGSLRKDAKVPLLLALPPMRPGQHPALPAEICKAVAREFKDPFAFSEVVPFAVGHAGGLQALQEAVRRIGRQESDYVMVSGVDSYLNAETLEWLDEHEQLKSENHPWGFIPGEAAGAVLVTSRRLAKGSPGGVTGVLVRTGAAREESLIHTEAVCLGLGLTAAIRGALEPLTAASEKADHTWCDLNGQPYRSEEFGYSVTRVTRQFEDVTDFTAPADCIGDIGGATGPVLLMLALMAGRKGYATGSRQLLWTSSDSGERTAALLRLEAAEEGR